MNGLEEKIEHKLHQVYIKGKSVVESCETLEQLRLSINWIAHVFHNYYTKKQDEYIQLLMQELQFTIDAKKAELEKPKEKPCQKTIKGYG